MRLEPTNTRRERVDPARLTPRQAAIAAMILDAHYRPPDRPQVVYVEGRAVPVPRSEEVQA